MITEDQAMLGHREMSERKSFNFKKGKKKSI